MDRKSRLVKGMLTAGNASLLKIFNLPRINRQLLKLNDRVQAYPILPVFNPLQNQHDPSPLPCLHGIIQSLPYGLGPLLPEVEFNGMGAGDAIRAGSIRKPDFRTTARLQAPVLLVFLFKTLVLGLNRRNPGRSRSKEIMMIRMGGSK
jgi:hypothetical protein